jgi:NitT/TauT family transport system substrate-binding protein
VTARLLALAGVALAFALSACGGDDAEPGSEKRTLRVGLSFSPGVDDAAPRVAFDRLAREEGIKANFTETGGPPNTAAALLRGDLDMGMSAFRSVVNAIGEGADLKVILGTAMSTDFFLVARKDIASVADLEGKRIAYGEPGGATEVVTKIALKRAGLGESDVKLSIVDDAQRRAAALVGDKVDAIALEYGDAQLLLAREPGLHIVASLYDIAPYLVSEVLVVRGSLIREDPEVVERVVGGLLDGFEYVRTPEGGSAWLVQAKEVAGPEEVPVLEKVYDRQRTIDYWPRKDQPLTAERYQRILRFWLSEGLLEKAVPFGDVWQISFWNTAAGT